MSDSQSSPLVCLRDLVTFKKGATVAYQNGITAEVHAVDDALLGCLLDGYCDLRSLSRRMAEVGHGGDVETWARRITALARSHNSIVKSRREPERPHPAAIVVHLAPWPGEVDGAAVAKTLAKDVPVWFVTPKKPRVRSPDGLTMCHGQQFGSRFEFAQWVKGLPARFPGVPLLLCGEADAVCVGAAAARGNVLVAVSPGWPGRAGAFQMWSACVRDSSNAGLAEDALYALLTLRGDPDWSCLRRGAASALGMAEIWAMLGARRVFYRTRAQGEALSRLGVEPDRLSILGPLRRERQPTPTLRRDGLLVFASYRGEGRSLLPVAELAAAAVDTGAFRFAALRSDGAWYAIAFTEDKVNILPWSDEPPSLEQFSVALAIAERFDEFDALPDCVGAGCRLRLVASAAEEPLLADLPRDAWLEGGPSDWVEQICRTARTTEGEPKVGAFVERCNLLHELRGPAMAAVGIQVHE